MGATAVSFPCTTTRARSARARPSPLTFHLFMLHAVIPPPPEPRIWHESDAKVTRKGHGFGMVFTAREFTNPELAHTCAVRKNLFLSAAALDPSGPLRDPAGTSFLYDCCSTRSATPRGDSYFRALRAASANARISPHAPSAPFMQELPNESTTRSVQFRSPAPSVPPSLLASMPLPITERTHRAQWLRSAFICVYLRFQLLQVTKRSQLFARAPCPQPAVTRSARRPGGSG